MLSVRIIPVEETYPLRHKVLWPHLAEQNCVTSTDGEEGAIHLGVFLDGVLIGVCSLFRTASDKLPFQNQYRLRAMATDPLFRGRNGAKALIESATTILRERGQEVLWCDARLGAVGFYEKQGFLSLPELYEIPLIGPHRFMWLEWK